LEGQPLQVVQDSCLLDLVGACFRDADLFAFFAARYLSKFVDVAVTALTFIKGE
jgi:hypothetical protein